MDNQKAVIRPNCTHVIVYYVIACAFSWPFFAWRDLYPENWQTSTVPMALRNLCIMWGPGIAGIICLIAFRKTHLRTITLTGSSVLKSSLFFFLPYLVWLILLLINPDQNTIQPDFFLELIPFGFLMIIGEELGWRSFLQDALRPLKEWKRWALIGLMWEFWHFTRGMVDGGIPHIIIRKLIMIASCILLAFIIGKLTDKTKSLLVAVTLHSWVDLQFEFQHINTHLAGGISLVIWTLLIWKWDKKTDSDKLANAKT